MREETVSSEIQSELLKRGYSLEEIKDLYALGRLYLDSGYLREASAIFDGLVDIVPRFYPASLAQAVIALYSRDYEAGKMASKRALSVDPQSISATLLLVIALFGLEDYNSAGSYLGEVRDAIESGAIKEKNILRVYRMLHTRYRGKL